MSSLVVTREGSWTILEEGTFRALVRKGFDLAGENPVWKIGVTFVGRDGAEQTRVSDAQTRWGAVRAVKKFHATLAK